MKTILCYGDSNTYGYNPSGGRYNRQTRWPCRLADLLGPNFEVVEEGCNNRTTNIDDTAGDWMNGLTTLHVCMASHKPIHMAIVMLGTNDLKRKFDRTPEDVCAGVEELVRELQTFSVANQGFPAKVLLVSPIHTGWRPENYPCTDFDENSAQNSQLLAPLYREAAQRLGCAFLDAATIAEPGDTDLVHLTADGHAALAQAIATALM